jgi:2-polyprenyl-6-hydroxyphenyl methylase / 3-demethylubiquinone-9 3-methyltransferase
MNTATEELAKFEKLGVLWRDPHGPMRPLHILGPLRTRWIADLLQQQHGDRPFDRLEILDVGCGAGLLSERLAGLGAQVCGIDPVARNIALARAAAEKAGQIIDYREGTPELLRQEGRQFDAVCALEVVEHIPDRPSFLRVLSALLRPGGVLFVTTINRTALSWLTAILAAERILHILPKGTHRWDWFVRPQEAQAILAREGLIPIDLRGMWYLPVIDHVRWTKTTGVNWAGAWRKNDDRAMAESRT